MAAQVIYQCDFCRTNTDGDDIYTISMDTFGDCAVQQPAPRDKTHICEECVRLIAEVIRKKYE